MKHTSSLKTKRSFDILCKPMYVSWQKKDKLKKSWFKSDLHKKMLILNFNRVLIY